MAENRLCCAINPIIAVILQAEPKSIINGLRPGELNGKN